MVLMNREPVSKPLSKAEVVALADDIQDLLADPEGGLNAATRAHWEGALAALEAVLGRRPSLLEDNPGLL